MTKFWRITFFLVFAVTGSQCAGGKSIVTSALVRSLIANEDINVRPNADEAGSPVLVNISLIITNMEQLTNKVDTMRAQGYITLGWNNPRLSWNTSEYSNTCVPLPASLIWTPDITFFNSAEVTSSLFSKEQQGALIYPNGNVLWIPRITLTFNYNKTNGEGHDTFAAKLLFGSWVYSSNDLDVNADSPSIEPVPEGSGYNNQFIIKKSTIERKLVHYECCTEGYPRLEVNLLIEKRQT